VAENCRTLFYIKKPKHCWGFHCQYNNKSHRTTATWWTNFQYYSKWTQPMKMVLFPTFVTCFAICRAESLCMRFSSSTKVTGSLSLTKCIPKFLLRDFHVNKTQSGKMKKKHRSRRNRLNWRMNKYCVKPVICFILDIVTHLAPYYKHIYSSLI
jgi:hypothetical protein